MKTIILTTSNTFVWHICQFDVFRHQYLPSTLDLEKKPHLNHMAWFYSVPYAFILSNYYVSTSQHVRHFSTQGTMQKTFKNSWVNTSIHGGMLPFNSVTVAIRRERQGVTQGPAKKRQCTQQKHCHNRKPEKYLNRISLTTNAPFPPHLMH